MEYYFFEEFKSRFNTVAIDYVHYPDEVFVNIKESYPVLPVVAISLFCWLALFWISKKLTAKMWETPASGKNRLIHFGAAAVLSAALLGTAGFQELANSARNASSTKSPITATFRSWPHWSPPTWITALII